MKYKSFTHYCLYLYGFTIYFAIMELRKQNIVGVWQTTRVLWRFGLQSVHQQLETACDLALIKYLICIRVLSFYVNICVYLLNMFRKLEFKREMFVAICSVVYISCWGTVPLLVYSIQKVWIYAVPYKSTPICVEIFLGFKGSTCTEQFTVYQFR